MLYVILAILLTFITLGAIFTAAIYRLWHNPPVVNVNLSLRDLPTSFNLVTEVKQPQIADVDTIPIPENIFTYVNAESDDWAKETRLRRARRLFKELGSWDAAFSQLQREDNLPTD